MIEPGHSQIPIRRQCDLIGLNPSTLYYQPNQEDPFNERLMRLIDAQYLRTPFYGVEHVPGDLNAWPMAWRSKSGAPQRGWPNAGFPRP
jgi:hypothetical protein